MYNSNVSSIISGAAAYSLVSALLSACSALAFLGLGVMTTALPVAVNSSELTAEQQNAVAAVSALGSLLPLFGVLFALVAVLLVVDAFGLFQRKSWAWMLTIVIHASSAVLSVLSWASSNFSFLSVATTLISAIIVYVFLTNADVKHALGKG